MLPREAVRLSVKNWIPSWKDVKTPPGPAALATALPWATSCFFFLARRIMALTSPPYSRSSSAMRGKQETSDMVSGSPAKMPDTIGAISLSSASLPNRRRPKSAKVSSSPIGALAIKGFGSRARRSLPGHEISLLFRKEAAPSGRRCSSPSL